jgi:hypothetical protein
LARDQDEATALVLAHIKTSPAEQVYDDLLVPGLNYARRDREKEELTESDEEFVLQATREVVEDLGESHKAANVVEGGNAAAAPTTARVRFLSCPARDEADRLALAMLQQMLDPVSWQIEVTAVETLTSELVERVAEEEPGLVCIGALPPGGLAHTRYLCKRMRHRFPRIKIIVGRWGLKGSVETNREQLQDAGADAMATTLLETRNQLGSLLPVLAHEQARRATDQKAGESREALIEEQQINGKLDDLRRGGENAGAMMATDAGSAR